VEQTEWLKALIISATQALWADITRSALSCRSGADTPAAARECPDTNPVLYMRCLTLAEEKVARRRTQSAIGWMLFSFDQATPPVGTLLRKSFEPGRDLQGLP
jgi:hypothetical protein